MDWVFVSNSIELGLKLNAFRHLITLGRSWLVRLWLACVLLGTLLASANEASKTPARILTHYALVSSQEDETWDPSAWRLLGSLDHGGHWVVLDSQTNKTFGSRGLRRMFPVTNQVAYSSYRLEILRLNGTNVPPYLQLAEWELYGPAVGVSNETELESEISASKPHPMLGLPENAFDGDPVTAWIDYGLGHPGGCWIQCNYVPAAHATITHLSQMRGMDRLEPRLRQQVGNAEIIRQHVESYQSTPLKTLTGYALTSANDAPNRDPRDWRLLGSNDGGKTWQTIDQRSQVLFRERLQRKKFMLNKPASYALYRLLVTATAGNRDLIQLSEIEPIISQSHSGQKTSIIVNAMSENPPQEDAGMAFDGDVRTKWLAPRGLRDGDLCWIQWQYIPEVKDLPVIARRALSPLPMEISKLMASFDTETNQPLVALKGYALTSANDHPDRDPKSWQLLGSNDRGHSWTILDTQEGQSFHSRLEQRSYPLPKPVKYSRFKLKFNSVNDPSTANAIQLSGIEPKWESPPPEASYSVVVRVAGDNPPRESIERAFDNDTSTKWLDFSVKNPAHASWVEWSLIPRSLAPLINLSENHIPQTQSSKPARLRLLGVPLAWNEKEHLLGFLDTTGFRWFKLHSLPSDMHFQELGAMEGLVTIRQLHPEVSDLSFYPSNALPLLKNTESSSTHLLEEPFLIGSVTGKVVAFSRDAAYATVLLSESAGQRDFPCRILMLSETNLSSLLGATISVRGVLETVFTQGGRRTLGAIWVPGMADVQVSTELPVATPASINRQENSTSPLTSIRQIHEWATQAPSAPRPVRIRGILTYIDLSLDDYYLQDGPDSIRGYVQQDAGLSPFLGQEGAYVELVGEASAGPPLVVQAHDFVRILGKGQMPEPARDSWDFLATGRDDGRWVEIEGIITGMTKDRLTLKMPGGEVLALVHGLDKTAAQPLVGSLVRLRGVCSAVMNGRGLRLGFRLLVPSSSHLEVLRPVPDDLFTLPMQPLDEVLQSRSDDLTRPAQFLRTTGVVTYAAPGMLFIQEKKIGLRVVLRESSPVQPGDSVDVVGLAAPDGGSAKLIQAVVRKTGHPGLPQPSPVALVGALVGEDGIAQDATRTRVQAVLASQSANDEMVTIEMHTIGTERGFSAYMPANSPNMVLPFTAGTVLNVVGVIKARTGPLPDVGQVVDSFELYVNGPRDFVVIRRPSWWTTTHTIWVLLGVAGAFGLSLVWVKALQRQVALRTRELEMEILERKRAEERVTESQKRLRTILDSEPECVQLVGRDKIIVDINPAGLRLLQARDQKEVVGQPMIEFAAPDNHETVLRIHEAVFNGEEAEEEFEVVGLGGGRRSVAARAVPMRDADGSVGTMLTVMRDVTAHKQLEEQLRQSQKMEAVGLLAGGIAHDFNNILTVISGLSEVMIAQGKLDAKELANLNHINQAAGRAAKLTQQLLAFGRKQVLRPRVISLHEVLIKMGDMLNRILGEDIELHLESTEGNTLIRADSGMVEQVVMNLAVNARDAMPNGGSLTLQTSALRLNAREVALRPEAREGNYVCLSVQDTGSGIAPELLPRIFEPFFTTKSVGKGTGLGLATVFGIMKQHQGWVEVESGMGKGACFRAFWPACESGEHSPSPALTERSIRRGKETILLVEDEPAVRLTALIALQDSGYQVIEAGSGPEALEIWGNRAQEISLLLTDVIMPGGMSGLDLAKRLKNERPSLKVICMSGYSREHVERGGKSSEHFEFLSKPYEIKELLGLVAICLDD